MQCLLYMYVIYRVPDTLRFEQRNLQFIYTINKPTLQADSRQITFVFLCSFLFGVVIPGNLLSPVCFTNYRPPQYT